MELQLSWPHFLIVSLVLSIQSITGAKALQHRRQHDIKVDSHGYEIVEDEMDANSKDHHLHFFQPVTRPDIDAPRWQIENENEGALAPGHFFVAPYSNRIQRKRGGGWVGPHIYDRHGELIWSGASEVTGFDTTDFKTAKMNGEAVLTYICRHEGQPAIWVMDQNYRHVKTLSSHDIGIEGADINMHEFTITADGQRAVVMLNSTKNVTPEQSTITGLGSECKIAYNGFAVLDTTTWEVLFSWSSEGHVGLNESLHMPFYPAFSCEVNAAWLYMHANSIDMFPDGDYLFGGRATSSLFKISAATGDIVWRFGGVRSDFEFEESFLGQHDARVVSQNRSHTVISLLDNEFVPHSNTPNRRKSARSLIIALQTDVHPMKAEILAQIDEPHGELMYGKGNVQLLPNGNTLVGWSEYSRHSEHGPNGELLMYAQLIPKLKSYRNFKFPWVGRPSRPPDVLSVSTGSTSFDDEGAITAISVSWNGATEVSSWKFYQTKADGTGAKLLSWVDRQGFETKATVFGIIDYVVVEALDQDEKSLGQSKIIKTISNVNGHNNYGLSPMVTFVLGVICSITMTLIGLATWRMISKRRNTSLWTHGSHAYESLSEDEEETESDEEPERVNLLMATQRSMIEDVSILYSAADKTIPGPQSDT